LTSKFTKAKSAFEETITIDPRNTKAHFSLGYTYLRDIGKVMQEYRTLVVLDRNAAQALLDLMGNNRRASFRPLG
jgi:hypothetical protein